MDLDRCKEIFGGKRITVMGLGLLGRGIGDVEFLSKCGATIVVTDKKSEEELRESIEKLSGVPNVEFHLGGHIEKDFIDTDLVIKAAGVPLDSLYIKIARDHRVEVAMSTALFAKYAQEAGVRIIGTTGTRGKSTVTQTIHHALIAAGRRSHLGGNVRGVSTLALLPEIQKGDIAVLELDSWQLQGFGDLGISPQIAIFTNLMPDHLNYYPDMDAYFSDKANIFRFQKAGDSLIVGQSIYERVKAENPPVEPEIPEPLPLEWRLALPGTHNQENAAFARDALGLLGLSEDEIRSGIETFAGIEGRLQYVRDARGVSIYNDNNASTPEATIAAIEALQGERHLTLIVGGTDKGVELSRLADAIDSQVDSLVLFSGTGTEKLKVLVRREYAEADSLSACLDKALEATPKGGIILFSPAFASFGPFVNYYDRGDQFLALVKEL